MNIDILDKLFGDDVQTFFRQFFEKMEPSDVIKNCSKIGFVHPVKIELKEVKDICCDYDNGTIIVAGKIIAQCEVEVREYNPNYDIAGDKYCFVGDCNPIYEASFSFEIDIDTRKIDNFVIDNIIQM